MCSELWGPCTPSSRIVGILPYSDLPTTLAENCSIFLTSCRRICWFVHIVYIINTELLIKPWQINFIRSAFDIHWIELLIIELKRRKEKSSFFWTKYNCYPGLVALFAQTINEHYFLDNMMVFWVASNLTLLPDSSKVLQVLCHFNPWSNIPDSQQLVAKRWRGLAKMCNSACSIFFNNLLVQTRCSTKLACPSLI